MKPFNFFMSLFAVGVFMGCSMQEDTLPGPEGMVPVSLNSFGKPVLLYVPDTTAAGFSVTEESSGDLRIVSGKQFDLLVRESAENLALRRRDIMEDEVNRLGSFIREDSVSLVWESSITQPEYHFIVNKRVKGNVYSFEDNRQSEVAPFNREAVLKMVEASLSARPAVRK